MLEVINLHKQFRLYDRPIDRLKEAISRRPRHRLYQALKGVSFQVAPGETLGVIGRNGAGKSTLLKIITGVAMPDQGQVLADGPTTGLLELGTGFNMALTGRQNIIANGLMLGLSRREIDARMDAIVDFAELSAFIDEPVRTYSSGMIMRLGFSSAIHAEPHCFVVDEALSVGDAHFQQKCMRRIRDFQAGGGSILFVSHDLNAVKMLCNRAVVLEQGEVVTETTPEAAVNHYNRLVAGQEEDAERNAAAFEDAFGYGSGAARVVEAELAGEDSGATTVTSGEWLIIRLEVCADRPVPDLTCGILLRDRFGQDIYGVNTHYLDSQLDLNPGDSAELRFRLRAELAAGDYTVTVALHSAENHLENCYHWCDNLLRLSVAGVRENLFSGVCRLPTECHQQRLAAKSPTDAHPDQMESANG
jgi:lipopolysaccharide transport system ATP-binding protein